MKEKEQRKKAMLNDTVAAARNPSSFSSHAQTAYPPAPGAANASAGEARLASALDDDGDDFSEGREKKRRRSVHENQVRKQAEITKQVQLQAEVDKKRAELELKKLDIETKRIGMTEKNGNRMFQLMVSSIFYGSVVLPTDHLVT